MTDILVITHTLNGLLMILLPILLGFYLNHKYRPGWRLWWLGAATFVASQIGHLPFNYWLTYVFNQGWLPVPPEGQRLIFNAVVLGLSSGIWEETARYVTYRWFARDARSWRKGLMLGAGHGGIEAIILGGIVLLTFVNMLAMRTINLEGVIPPEQVELASQQIQSYWSMPWYSSLLGALERLFTLIFHLSASLLVLQVFLRRQIRWLWLAIGWHATINAIGVYSAARWGTTLTEGLIGIAALISLGIILALKTSGGKDEDQPSELPLQMQDEFEMPVIEETDEALDKTRYQ